MKKENYIFEKGTFVSSVTQQLNGEFTSTTSGEIIFDYEFTKEELVNEYEGIMLFLRSSEDGKKHMYFVEVN